MITVRVDRCRLGPVSTDLPSLSGSVVAVEYQGATVRVSLTTEQGGEVAAVVPDSDYYAKPVNPGEAATLIWSERDVHVLAEA
jgi:putative spermidine/putrescine transport system ATP-binding protein